MNTNARKGRGVFSGFFTNGPWRSKSVLAALAAVVVGGGVWFSGVRKSSSENADVNVTTNMHIPAPSPAGDLTNATHWDWSKPLPFYVPACASYVAGFCIGWLFRKVMRVVVVAVALVISLLALGRFAGCNIKPAQEQVKRSGEWAQDKAAATQDYLLRLLPSATGGGLGVFLGFRRRRKAASAEPG